MKPILFMLPIMDKNFIKKFIFGFALFLIIQTMLISCLNPNQKNTPPQQSSELLLDSLLPLTQLIQDLQPQPVSIGYDYVLKSKISFNGFSFQKIFSKWKDFHHLDTGQYAISFVCADGYVASTSWNKLLSDKGYLITNINSIKSNQPNSLNNFEPAYMTWNITENFTDYIFPYAIIGFKIVDRTSFFVRAKPEMQAEPKIWQGFELCKTNCLKCHSVNQEGGIVGPELNVPLNVTEYWQEPFLFKFIKNPSSIRLHSKMPTLDSLDDLKIQVIINYLSYMKSHKSF